MSKLAPHVIVSTPAALAWSRVSKLVKVIDNTQPFKEAHAADWLVWRHAVSNESDTSNPIGTVDASIAALGGFQDARLVIQIWCGAHPTRDQLTAAVKHCHDRGYLTCGSSWFTGDYTQADWDDATASGQDFYGPQAYFGNQGYTIWHALRHRQFWKPGNRPVMILEAGRDAVEGGKAGWKISGVTQEQYLAELIAYNVELNKDPYVLGATIFSNGPTPDWNNFNVDRLVPQLIAAQGVLPVPAPPPSPTPIPPTYSVGSGVKALIVAQGDTPRSDEVYEGRGSTTWGEKGIYYWLKATGEVKFVPFK